MSLRATTRSGGRQVTIASGRTRIAVPSTTAARLPLNATGRQVLHSNQKFHELARFRLADGRTVTESYTPHFLPSATGTLDR